MTNKPRGYDSIRWLQEFDILSLNTKGLRDKLKRNKLFIYAKNHLSANGILFMQETHSCIGDELSWSTQFDGKMWFMEPITAEEY